MTWMPPGDYDDDMEPVWTPNIHGTTGSAHNVSGDQENEDAARQLRDVVAEVTNGRIPAPTKRRIGFY